MLITKEQIEKACDLLPDELNNAMLNGGYADKYEVVQFEGMSPSGQFVYQVSGWDRIEGKIVRGLVFLQYMRGALAQGFYLVGDY